MKQVKRYFLTPENRYKAFLLSEHRNENFNSSDEQDNPSSVNEPNKEMVNLIEPKGGFQKSNENNEELLPQKSEEESQNQVGGQTEDIPQSPPKIPQPPPGIPVRNRKKRELPWISLKP